MAKVRTFVGLPLPDEYKNALASLRRNLAPALRSRLSWTRPENWHLTLKFLGDVDQDRIPEIFNALAAVAWTPFTMQAGNGGFFPPVKRRRDFPRVMWLGLAQGRNHCRDLAQKTDDALSPLGIPRENRPFTAHLTVARIKKAEKDDWDRVLVGLDGLPWPTFVAERFVLWKSVLSSRGPAYSPLAEFSAAPDQDVS